MSKKKTVDIFGDAEAVKRPPTEFESLLNSASQRVRTLSPGERFIGEILAVTGSEAFISTGTATDAVMPFGANAEKPIVGDHIEVVVVRAREGEIIVKEVGGLGSTATADSLEDAFEMELPVEGTVTESIKGGFRVKIQGVSGFCPISQIDWRCENPADHVGRKYEFIITKWEKGRDLVVSRRKILEQERAASEGQFMVKHQVGDIFSGVVFRIEKYGAFVRLPEGIEGLIPISEMSFSRINHPQEVVNLDQPVKVKLINMREEGDRLMLSFSLKEGGDVVDPWATIESTMPVGTVVNGTVEHKESFGLFVRLTAGVTGLLPRSAWRDAVEGKDYENKRKGDVVNVRVARIDLDARKISLSLPGQEEDDSWRGHGSVNTPAAKSLGTLADLFKGIKVK